MTTAPDRSVPMGRRNLLKYAAAGTAGLALPLGATSAAAAANTTSAGSLTAPANGADAALSAHLKQLHQRALDEGGKLVVYAGGDARNQEDGTMQAFRAAFPGIDITVKVDLSKYQDGRIDRQLALGELEPDLAQLQTLHDFDHWKQQGDLLPYKPWGWEHVHDAYKDRAGAYVGITVYSFGRVSNTDLLTDAQAPRDASDFLDARFRNQLVFTYPNDDDAVLYAFHLIVQKYGLRYMERLMAQEPQFVRGSPATLSAIASGRKLATLAGAAPLRPVPGLPVRYVVPRTDKFMSWAQTVAIFKQARHPNAAKLYLTWQLTRERQAAGFQWSVRRDVAPPTGWGPVTAYNTPISGFHRFMRDRAAVERFRGVIEAFVGPVRGPSPLDT